MINFVTVKASVPIKANSKETKVTTLVGQKLALKIIRSKVSFDFLAVKVIYLIRHLDIFTI